MLRCGAVDLDAVARAMHTTSDRDCRTDATDDRAEHDRTNMTDGVVHDPRAASLALLDGLVRCGRVPQRVRPGVRPL